MGGLLALRQPVGLVTQKKTTTNAAMAHTYLEKSCAELVLPLGIAIGKFSSIATGRENLVSPFRLPTLDRHGQVGGRVEIFKRQRRAYLQNNLVFFRHHDGKTS